MIRVRKLTDYAIILLAHMAQNADKSISARLLAQKTNIPVPTVSKVLKILAKKQLISSHRGALGGYKILRKPEDISVAEMIGALEGPIAITECALSAKHICNISDACLAKGPWQQINRVVNLALEDLSLAQMANSYEKPQLLKINESKVGG